MNILRRNADYLAPFSASGISLDQHQPFHPSGLADLWFLVDLSKILLPHTVCPSVSQHKQQLTAVLLGWEFATFVINV